MHNLPTKPPTDDDLDAMLRDKMGEIEALVKAIEEGAPDCDLKLAELLESESETVRIAIVKKLREILSKLEKEKQQELEQMLAVEQRIEVERKRGMFQQWLQWMMSEETIRKMRDAFLAMPIMERVVRGVGQDMAERGMNNIQLGDKRDLGGLGTNVPDVRGRGREKGQGRE